MVHSDSLGSLPTRQNFLQTFEKLSVHPSKMLRANGGGREIVGNFPFMLIAPKHENTFQQFVYFFYLIRWPSRFLFSFQL